MKWQKKGCIFMPDGSSPWARHTALQPTPLLIGDDVIRVFVGMRDDQGVGRVGYVDVSAGNPKEILGVSEKPCLDVGTAGAFDENGVIPCAVVRRDERIFLYYAGYMLGQKVRFLVFGGLAVSHDNGETFTRYSRVPIIDRTDDELLFRVIHSIIEDGGSWKAYYGAGDSFRTGSSKSLPVYNIRYMESPDGVQFPLQGKVALDISGDEHRVGRPYVIKEQGVFRMFFGAGSEAEPYRLAYAESQDGKSWDRKDEELLGLSLSPEGWDSQMMAYPAVIRCRDRVYMFYNGNDYGRSGFGYAELVEW